MKRIRTKSAAVRLYPLSVAFVLALALLLAPLSRLVASQKCDMPGASVSQGKSCHGCCAAMKCCSVSTREEKSQPVQPASSRLNTSADTLLAVTPKVSVLLYALPDYVEDYRPLRVVSATPVFSSLARLCIRLI